MGGGVIFSTSEQEGDRVAYPDVENIIKLKVK
jgi:hypothetical protein